mmetsp:Transcript_23514/g.53122  ORF Transcript_23514/g.53122 Transcript_23514/m.53122 type:complete len:115 (-) Transcript_23514:1147-1491(-)
MRTSLTPLGSALHWLLQGVPKRCSRVVLGAVCFAAGALVAEAADCKVPGPDGLSAWELATALPPEVTRNLHSARRRSAECVADEAGFESVEQAGQTGRRAPGAVRGTPRPGSMT